MRMHLSSFSSYSDLKPASSKFRLLKLNQQTIGNVKLRAARELHASKHTASCWSQG